MDFRLEFVLAAIFVSTSLLITGCGGGNAGTPSDGPPLDEQVYAITDEALLSANLKVRVVLDHDDLPAAEWVVPELAQRVVCCGTISQVAPVFIEARDASTDEVPAWAVSYDTASAGQYPTFVAPFTTTLPSDAAYFVAFFDARTMKHIYTLAPGERPYPWMNSDPLVPGGPGGDRLEQAGFELDYPSEGKNEIGLPGSGNFIGLVYPEYLLAEVKSDDWSSDGPVGS